MAKRSRKKKAAANTNIAKKEEKVPALNLSLMEEDASSGLENIHQEDLATPRLKVLMQLSPELEDIDGAKAGMIYNTVTNDCLLYTSPSPRD